MTVKEYVNMENIIMKRKVSVLLVLPILNISSSSVNDAI